MILLIDNYDSFTYNLYQALAKLSKQPVKVIFNNKLEITDIKKLNTSAIVLSPGPGRPEDAGICVNVIKQYGGKIPLLGVCLGHQAVGIAFGGKVIQTNEIVHGKPASIFHDNSILYKGLLSPFTAGRYHSLVISPENFPEELIVTAKTKNDLIMGVQHKTLPIYGVQFHPESIMTPAGERLLENFINLSH